MKVDGNGRLRYWQERGAEVGGWDGGDGGWAARGSPKAMNGLRRNSVGIPRA